MIKIEELTFDEILKKCCTLSDEINKLTSDIEFDKEFIKDSKIDYITVTETKRDIIDNESERNSLVSQLSELKQYVISINKITEQIYLSKDISCLVGFDEYKINHIMEAINIKINEKKNEIAENEDVMSRDNLKGEEYEEYHHENNSIENNIRRYEKLLEEINSMNQKTM